MKCTQSILYAAIVALFCIVAGCQAKKNRDAPHVNSGILPAYEPGPFGQIKLSGADEGKLQAGKPVMKQTEAKDGEQGGGAICVQDVDAPKEAVWSQILDLDAYKGKVPKVNDCKNYVVRENNDGTCTVKTKMVIGVIPGYSTSDFEDVSGHWHLEEHPTKPDCTRVFYACDVKLMGAIPKPVANYLSKSALKTATGWVKKESEKKPEGKIPAQLASFAFTN